MDLMPIKTSECIVPGCQEKIPLGTGATCDNHITEGATLITEFEGGIPAYNDSQEKN